MVEADVTTDGFVCVYSTVVSGSATGSRGYEIPGVVLWPMIREVGF